MLERLSKHDEVDLRTRVLRWESDHSLIFKQSLHASLTLDDLVERRVFELGQSHLRLLQLRHDSAILRLGPPTAHSKDVAGLAELREDKIAVLVEALQFLAEAAAQGERLNVDLQYKQVVASLY